MDFKFVNNPTPKPEVNKKKGHVSTTSFIPIEPEWSLDEVILSSTTRGSIEDIISFCKNKDKIIQEWELYRFMKGSGGCIGINFWGLPGTGKSIAAEAVAKAIGKKIIQVSYASLMDSLQGNTEKNISALFQTAVDEDCVILFDEADGLLSARKTNSSNSDSANLIKSHLLTILERSSAIVIFTTNFFKSYDRAFVRRILWNIEFSAPDIDELTQLWKLHIGTKVPRTIEYSNLAYLTDAIAKTKNIKITGGDIRKMTLMFCTRLTSGKINQIDESTATEVIEKYLSDLEETNSADMTRKQVLSKDELPQNIRKELE